jgi:hypothetical protein
MKSSDNLFEKLLLNLTSYPDDVKPIKQRLKGTAFFPGGDGIYKEGNFKHKDHYPIMVVGQDYDNEYNFHKVFESPTQSELSNSNKTWFNLKKILGEEVLQNCFFTNAIMGLRIGNSKNIGISKAFKKNNEPFLLENQQFFNEQLNEIKPKLIICLGAQLPRFIGACYLEQLVELAKVRSFSQLDFLNESGVFKLKYTEGEANLIFITHPALYDANIGRRRNGNGRDFEENLIKNQVQKLQI